jgi:hypothetical protein
MQSIAVSVVRNCRDIIALSVLHHVLLGVDRCIVIDNGSTDGTTELLRAIAKRVPKVEIRSDPSVATTFPGGKAPVYDRQCSFVEIEYPRKMIFCAEGEVAIGVGAHDVQMPDRALANCDQFFCLHLPLRSKAELAKRAFDHEPRRRPFRAQPDHSWHLRHIHEMMIGGESEAAWRANSYDGSGMIDIFGQHRLTKIDMRLVRRMARAYVYGLYLRIPMGARAG